MNLPENVSQGSREELVGTSKNSLCSHKWCETLPPFLIHAKNMYAENAEEKITFVRNVTNHNFL